MNPSDRKYSREHEWAKSDAKDLITVGITHYAQDQLGDIVYIDLPKVGAKIEQFKKLGEVESVKAVSDIYTPVGGEVVEVNKAVSEKPETVNQDPFEKGWLVKIKPTNGDADLQKLMTADQYDTFLKTEAH
jgi:glycine cleavage system H protein